MPSTFLCIRLELTVKQFKVPHSVATVPVCVAPAWLWVTSNIPEPWPTDIITAVNLQLTQSQPVWTQVAKGQCAGLRDWGKGHPSIRHCVLSCLQSCCHKFNSYTGWKLKLNEQYSFCGLPVYCRTDKIRHAHVTSDDNAVILVWVICQHVTIRCCLLAKPPAANNEIYPSSPVFIWCSLYRWSVFNKKNKRINIPYQFVMMIKPADNFMDDQCFAMTQILDLDF